jgi:hypothetical protein
MAAQAPWMNLVRPMWNFCLCSRGPILYASPFIHRLCKRTSPPQLSFARRDRLRVCQHWLVRAVKQNVPIYAHGELVSRRYLDRRPNVKVPPGNHSSGLAQFPTHRGAGRIPNARVRWWPARTASWMSRPWGLPAKARRTPSERAAAR